MLPGWISEWVSDFIWGSKKLALPNLSFNFPFWILLIQGCETNQLLQSCSKTLQKRQNKRAKSIFHNLIHNRLNTQGESICCCFLHGKWLAKMDTIFLKYFNVWSAWRGLPSFQDELCSNPGISKTTTTEKLRLVFNSVCISSWLSAGNIKTDFYCLPGFFVFFFKSKERNHYILKYDVWQKGHPLFLEAGQKMLK